ncbi:hypothetical protein HYALB_00013712 [Hymenoscyphus albidus]|uniref:Uncharacterized protein n=1 Tax=Hymenoscyphus albidus TaxID=595503 RepID=A0A9N9QBM4_9HELO|nr:hypothetical protein HYALB_00013712 [Hymenoscyphus albidus]
MLVPNVFTATAVLSAFVVGLPLGASNDALIQRQSIATEVEQEDPSLDKRARIRFTIGPVAKTKFKIGRSESRPAGHVTRRTDDNGDLPYATSPPDEGGVLTKRVLRPIPKGGGSSTQLPPWFPRFTKHHTNAKRQDVVDSVSDEDTTAPLAKRVTPWGTSENLVKGGSIELIGKPIPKGSLVRLKQTTKASEARVEAPVGLLKTMERILSQRKPKKPEAAG